MSINKSRERKQVDRRIRTENRRLVQGGGGMRVEYIPGAVSSKATARRGGDRGLNGFARYSDEAYECRAVPRATGTIAG